MTQIENPAHKGADRVRVLTGWGPENAQRPSTPQDGGQSRGRVAIRCSESQPSRPQL